MADNTTLPGTGDVIATDDIGGVKYPIGKLAFGALDTATLVSPVNGLPVSFQRDAATHVATTATPLGISATYTSPTFDSLTTGTFVTHHMFADQDGTHIYEVSIDSTNWETVDSDALLAGDSKTEAHLVTARYHRARFVNGGTAQTVFRHQVICRVVGAPHEMGILTSMNTVQGNKTHNTTAPSALAHEVLGFVAKAAAPTYAEGAAVEARVTLTGDQAITLDGEVVSVTGTFWQSTQPVSLASVPSHNVTNAGTFATQATLTAETTKVIGTVNIAAAQTVGLSSPVGGGTEAAALRVTLANDSTGVVSIDDNGASLTVDGTFWQATQPVSGTFWQATQPVSGTFWQATQPISGTVTASDATGNVSHDNPDSGNPIKTGGIARAANPTAVAALDRVDSFYDLEGRQIVQPFGPRGLTVHNTITLSSTTETTLIAAGAAGIFHDVLGIFVANSSATAVYVTIKDATTGTTRTVIYSPAGQNAGMMLPIPITQAAAANNWTATLSAAVSSVYVTAIAVKKTG